MGLPAAPSSIKDAVASRSRSRHPAERQQPIVIWSEPMRHLSVPSEGHAGLVRFIRRRVRSRHRLPTSRLSPPRVTMRRYLKPKLIAGAVMASSGRRVCQIAHGAGDPLERFRIETVPTLVVVENK